jgi:hypothetical protein
MDIMILFMTTINLEMNIHNKPIHELNNPRNEYNKPIHELNKPIHGYT